MGYGHFKSEGRAARRGNIAQFRGIFGTVLLRPVKSSKGGTISVSGETRLNRHWKGAAWAGGHKVKNTQQLTRL